MKTSRSYCCPSRTTLSKRNVSFFRRYQEGETLSAIAKRKLSTERVRQIVKAVADRLGEQVAVHKPRNPFKILSKESLEPLAKGQMGVKRFYTQFHTSKQVVNRSRAFHGIQFKRHLPARLRHEAIYNEFIAGATDRELATKHNTTVGAMRRTISYYRQCTGKPGKRAVRNSFKKVSPPS